MNTRPLLAEMPPLLLQMQPAIHMTDEEFFAFCRQNRFLRIERTAEGEIIVMPPAGVETSYRNNKISRALDVWATQDGRGVTFDSSAGFTLPNGAVYSPDAAWVLRSRFADIAPAQKQKFPPVCPDFVVELRSPSDRLQNLKEKMEEYITNGVQLGWLIDPEKRQIFVYRPDTPVLHLPNPTTISGDPLLPGFTLSLTDIWDPDF